MDADKKEGQEDTSKGSEAKAAFSVPSLAAGKAYSHMVGKRQERLC